MMGTIFLLKSWVNIAKSWDIYLMELGDNVIDRYDEVENDYITCLDEDKSH